jgi:PAS domain S-box-containing protein
LLKNQLILKKDSILSQWVNEQYSQYNENTVISREKLHDISLSFFDLFLNTIDFETLNKQNFKEIQSFINMISQERMGNTHITYQLQNFILTFKKTIVDCLEIYKDPQNIELLKQFITLTDKLDQLIFICVDLYTENLETDYIKQTGYLKTQSKLMETVNQLFRIVLTCDCGQVEHVAQFCLEKAIELTDAKFGFIGEVNKHGLLDTFVMSPTGWERCNIPENQKTCQVNNMTIRGIWGSVIKNNITLNLSDPLNHPDSVGLPDGHPPLKSFLGVPLVLDNKAAGIISLANKEKGFTKHDQYMIEKLSIAFLEALTSKRKDIELKNHHDYLEELIQDRTKSLEELNYNLNERIKELNCLISMSDIIDNTYVLDEIIQQVVNLIPTAMQYPEDTCARITLYDQTWKTDNFRETPWKLHNNIIINNNPAGSIEVYHLIEKPLKDAGPFLKEEVVLLKTMAEKLAGVIEHQHTLKELYESEEKYRKLVNNLPQKIFYKDRGLTYLAVNELFAADFNLSPENIVGKNDFELYPAEKALEYQKIEEQVIKSGQTLNYDQVIEKSGQKEYFNIIITPVKDDQGLIAGLLGIIWNITERIEYQERLKETVEALKLSNKELEQFAYVASHDLQEPLRMIASYLQLIERRYKDQLDDDACEFIGYAVDGANRLKKLINDLLAFSRVGTRGEPFEKNDLNSIVQTALINLKETIEETEAIIKCDSLPALPVDKAQMTTVFQNLIANAIKFKSDKPPEIYITCEEKEDEWLISIKDNGIGFSSEYYEKVFVIFQRLHTIKDYPGTGIGLAICKKIIERHGGKVWVESIPEKGSTFFFNLPKRKRFKENNND